MTLIVARMVTSLWLGGQILDGDTARVILGGVVSTTVTSWVASPLFLLSSTAVQSTSVMPSGKRRGLRGVVRHGQRGVAEVCGSRHADLDLRTVGGGALGGDVGGGGHHRREGIHHGEGTRETEEDVATASSFTHAFVVNSRGTVNGAEPLLQYRAATG